MKKEYYIFKINLKILNVISILIFILLFGITLLFYPNIIVSFLEKSKSINYYLMLFPVMIIYFSFHEIFHAIGYILHGANWKKITFGMELEKSIFYCLCKQDISRKNILNSLLFPLFYLGIVTYIISIIFNFPLLLILSILNICGAAADVMYFVFIIKLKQNINYSELDSGISFAILADYDVTKVRHIGLDFIEKRDIIKRTDFKKIKISKLSFAVLVLCLLLIVISVLI